MKFQLDPRLEADTFPVRDLVLCRVLLMNDGRFPWLILVPRRPDMREIIDLGEADAAILLAEIRAASQVTRALFQPHKLNVAALGNAVPQLHVHIIARQTTDEAWPRPIWGVGTSLPYDPKTASKQVQELAQAFDAHFGKAMHLA